MNNPTISLSAGITIKLPALSSGRFKQTIGYIEHIIENEKQVKIVAIEDVPISPRLKEKQLALADGQKVLITKRKKVELPSTTDGILFIDHKNQLIWQTHKRINEFRNQVAQKGLEQVAKAISATWEDAFKYRAEKRNANNEMVQIGLRPPQIGGLHAIGGHWSLYNQSATLVMPTGTGKTETMLATLIAHQPGKTLIVVPSKALRGQTFNKFANLGLLRFLGTLTEGTKNPIVGLIHNAPKKAGDLEFFSKCNVIIAIMDVLTEPTAVSLYKMIAEKVDTLIVDEAHHIAAPGWSAFKEFFNEKKVLQFTATPYRRDGKLVDGKVVYEYALNQAQQDGYFKKINFIPVHEIDPQLADETIAKKAIAQLTSDLATYDHILMARCANTARASEIFKIYNRLAAEYKPVLVYSGESSNQTSLDKLFNRESRIVVCVNMLGEGFDLPQLKIAAIHDIHKSLAILLQFTGRFTRSSANAIGEAAVVANTARVEVSDALERLYSEDADWNYLLSEMSSQAAKAHAELISFLNESKRLDENESEESETEISNHLLRPTFNTSVHYCENFQPKRFHEGILENMSVEQVWIHEESNTIYFITKNDFPLKWTRAKSVKDREWHLFILHHDEKRNLLFFSTTEKSATYDKMLRAVGATQSINGEQIFKSLGRISRLVFQNIGVKKHGRRNLRFAMYVGADVVQALTITEKGGSSKSNLSGIGWEDGHPITIGCSAKGRIWARDPGTIPELIRWCENVGDKLLDPNIDPSKIIDNVLIPEEAENLPNALILSIDWPIELLRRSEEKVDLFDNIRSHPLSMVNISVNPIKLNDTELEFSINFSEDAIWATYLLKVGGDLGYTIGRKSGDEVSLKIGKINMPFEDYLNEYPPLIRFTDLSELDGNLLVRPQNPQQLTLPDKCLEAWDWRGTDITKESMWKDQTLRQDSIQWKAANAYIQAGFDVVFDDDAPGEAGDIVVLKEDTEVIRLVLVHCKFTEGATPGERVKDVVEVSSQAVRSTKWKWKFKDLCAHIIGREKRLSTAHRQTRFLKGGTADVNRFSQISRFKRIQMEIIIVQPGVSVAALTSDQLTVLASAHSFLKETIGIDLQVICSQ